MDILQNFLTTGFFYTIIRVSTPLIFASLSSLIARKGGVTNITIDSTMIMSALTGVHIQKTFGWPWSAGWRWVWSWESSWGISIS